MRAEWVTAIAAAVALGGGFMSWAWRAARREGKVDALLERLTDVAEDHENRLRDVERTVTIEHTKVTRGRLRHEQ